jgi:hypothetical protein
MDKMNFSDQIRYWHILRVCNTFWCITALAFAVANPWCHVSMCCLWLWSVVSSPVDQAERALNIIIRMIIRMIYPRCQARKSMISLSLKKKGNQWRTNNEMHSLDRRRCWNKINKSYIVINFLNHLGVQFKCSFLLFYFFYVYILSLLILI